MKIIGKYTRQRDPEVLEKFYDDLVPDLPRIPYVDDASAAQRSRRPLIVPVSE